MRNLSDILMSFVCAFILMGCFLTCSEGTGKEDTSKLDTIYIQDSVIFYCHRCGWKNCQYVYMISDTIKINEKKYKRR